MRRPALLCLSLLLVAAPAVPAFAQDEKPDEKKPDASPAAVEPVVTEHTVTIDGNEVAYIATAGTLPLVGEDEDPEADANLFYIAYTVKPKEGEARPVTFCFNGGPGSSSVWLHMGMLGPKIVPIPDDASFPTPPYDLRDNPHSLLDKTDLVFIDPVGTGYSRPAKDDDDRSRQKEFSGYSEDLDSVGEFIHRYVTANGRWGSPKFLLGESYGTLRAAGLAGHLNDRYNLTLNGVVFVSAVLDFATLREDSNNDLPYVLFLPTLATTAHYHGTLAKSFQSQPLDEVYKEAKAFALGPYATALLRGVKPSSEEGQAIAARLAGYTGLSEQFVIESNLRVGMQRFGKELLRGEGKTLGRFDSRFVAPSREGRRRPGRFRRQRGRDVPAVHQRPVPPPAGEPEGPAGHPLRDPHREGVPVELWAVRGPVRPQRRRASRSDGRQPVPATLFRDGALRPRHPARRVGVHHQPPDHDRRLRGPRHR